MTDEFKACRKRYVRINMKGGRRVRLRVSRQWPNGRISGFRVNEEGDEIIKKGALQFMILAKADCEKITELEWDRKYGTLKAVK